jgi:hypothetical protein
MASLISWSMCLDWVDRILMFWSWMHQSVSVKIETVHLNGQATMEMIETLVTMASKLPDEVTHLKIYYF